MRQARPQTLTGLLVVVALAVVLVLPALGYLLWLTQTQGWNPDLTVGSGVQR
jgi:cytochrome d ubiquinol oxidase subunit II